MKRFTETAKWRDKWFRKLPATSKLLWLYLCDNCDHAGVIDLDLEAASFDIGEPVKPDHLTALESRLQRLANGKIWITAFIAFQYGKLSRLCRPHTAVFDALEHHGLSPEAFLHSPNGALKAENSQRVADRVADRVSGTLPKTLQDQDKDQDKDQYRGGVGENEYLIPTHTAVTTGDAIFNSDQFEKFWKAYPNQKKKASAERAFIDVGGPNLLGVILKAIQIQKTGLEWQKDNGRYIPLPENWLRDQRWLDAPPKPRSCF